MALDVLGFVLRHKFVIAFYLLAFALVYVYRKKFQFQLKFIAICRTKLGLGLMDRIAGRHKELVKLFGYVSIGVGFAGMLFIVFVLGQSVVTLLTVPNSPSPLSPVLPGVRIPGVPEGFFVPFVQGVIAIFIVAVVHEFAHGVVARAHDVKVLSSGPAIIGPIFAAFVEPDEKQIQKKGDVVNYSIFAAGTASNVVLTLFVLLLLSAAFLPVGSAFFGQQGVVLEGIIPGSPAAASGLVNGTAITSIGGQPILSVQAAQAALQPARPGDSVAFGNSQANYSVVAGKSEQDGKKAYFGILMRQVYRNENTVFFRIFSWLEQLLYLTATLSLGIGLANMIPAGPLDGGKMLLLALQRSLGTTRGKRVFVIITFVVLATVVFLLSPIFVAIAKSVAGAF